MIAVLKGMTFSISFSSAPPPPTVKQFWDSLATWVDGREGVRAFPDDLTEEEFLLGIVSREGDYSLINYLILYAKFYIYKTSVFLWGRSGLLPLFSGTQESIIN